MKTRIYAAPAVKGLKLDPQLQVGHNGLHKFVEFEYKQMPITAHFCFKLS